MSAVVTIGWAVTSATAAGVQLSRGYFLVAAGTTNFNISACFICLTTSAPMHT